ncbi:uncharacterized protein LOC103572166 [Microplitis demolitor]|uniref:uncharacterized protein LOC103572166 n=1 Tax=Microplitis demolitor TaxID=69319 RepID=UPI0004CCD7E1|nr:uncharacterized protein LOC103572166 [Microplitis demolitor]
MNINKLYKCHNNCDGDNNNHNIDKEKLKAKKPIDEPACGIFNGDNLIIKMKVNHQQLEIIGDGCQVTITNNHAKVKIIGDGGVIKILGDNFGDLVYYGDGGKILLGLNNNFDKVEYVGDGGEVNNKKLIKGLPAKLSSATGYQKISGTGIRTTRALTSVKKIKTPD